MIFIDLYEKEERDTSSLEYLDKDNGLESLINLNSQQNSLFSPSVPLKLYDANLGYVQPIRMPISYSTIQSQPLTRAYNGYRPKYFN